jgi:tRNA U34 5-carboxymethylaminomethyl modifying GTPase MnmE/TrmE
MLRGRRSRSNWERREFVAADLWSALDALGEVSGRRTSEEALDLIFSRFCIGK